MKLEEMDKAEILELLSEVTEENERLNKELSKLRIQTGEEDVDHQIEVFELKNEISQQMEQLSSLTQMNMDLSERIIALKGRIEELVLENRTLKNKEMRCQNESEKSVILTKEENAREILLSTLEDKQREFEENMQAKFDEVMEMVKEHDIAMIDEWKHTS